MAIGILVLAVLPAEYGIDPTGLGKRLGLTALATTVDDEIVDPIAVSCNEELSQWKDVITLVVPPHSGLEYKFQLVKGATLEYAWKTNGEQLYFDFHGEPKGDKTGYFKSFQISTDSQASGALIAPFEGIHGWYWENKTLSPITLFLNTKGSYAIAGLM